MRKLRHYVFRPGGVNLYIALEPEWENTLIGVLSEVSNRGTVTRTFSLLLLRSRLYSRAPFR